jgi:hypothetical protein
MSRLRIKPLQSIVFIALSVTQPALSHIRTKPEGFSITLPVNYDRLLGVMREVCSDGIIHGTFQYEGESEVTGAESAISSKAFPELTKTGDDCFKVRRGAISPAHFVGSNDQGSITVRYAIERVSTEKTRISIDAVFVEDSGHHRHVSQGLVETREFREIAQKLKALDQGEKASQVEARIHDEEVEWERYSAELKELQRVLEAEKKRLVSTGDSVQELQRRLQSLQHQVLARVKVPGAELKAFPFLHAATLGSVPAGSVVHILQRTDYWDRVRISVTEEGWLYHLSLENLP